MTLLDCDLPVFLRCDENVLTFPVFLKNLSPIRQKLYIFLNEVCRHEIKVTLDYG